MYTFINEVLVRMMMMRKQKGVANWLKIEYVVLLGIYIHE